MAAWAKANPGLAVNKKKEYIEKHGSDSVDMPDFPANLQFLRGTKIEAIITGNVPSAASTGKFSDGRNGPNLNWDF